MKTKKQNFKKRGAGITRSQFLKNTIGIILASIGLSKAVKAEDKYIGSEVHKWKIDEDGLTPMPYPNMGIMIPKGHSGKKIRLEWVDGQRFGKVEAIEDPNGKYIIWKPKQQ